MDPITTAIGGGLLVGAAKGATTVGEQAVVDSYAGLKALIVKRFGDSKVTKAVAELEANPESDARRAVLHEEVQSSGADKDPELLTAAQKLLDAVGEAGGIKQNILTATGDGNAQAADGGTASVTHVHLPKP